MGHMVYVAGNGMDRQGRRGWQKHAMIQDKSIVEIIEEEKEKEYKKAIYKSNMEVHQWHLEHSKRSTYGVHIRVHDDPSHTSWSVIEGGCASSNLIPSDLKYIVILFYFSSNFSPAQVLWRTLFFWCLVASWFAKATLLLPTSLIFLPHLFSLQLINQTAFILFTLLLPLLYSCTYTLLTSASTSAHLVRPIHIFAAPPALITQPSSSLTADSFISELAIVLVAAAAVWPSLTSRVHSFFKLAMALVF